ncbi:hypothetical protein SNOG_09205 [Parastagonospora nodorum SN15]|uniref:Uncharacterized protein n=1 Tax=Phaeosphaeria nodorum (strain SN15 / ATCC MYA-4574 / FGSC 10173) TaxID=321614 RepID=Q0UGA9_PHANO|nr:hypothetical protein SNOG_09205 [Parastagonospora nodorum SN15]EAT83397.1 hypothetical protein SNOG_09205 [Parastagonospora nodorum SN15]
MHTNSLVKHSPVPAMLHDQSTEYEMLFNPKIYHNRKFLMARRALQALYALERKRYDGTTVDAR